MLRLAPFALSLVFVLGCDKSGSPAGEAAQAETAAKPAPQAEGAAAATEPAAKTAVAATGAEAAAEAEAGSCGGMEGGEAKAACGGEGEEGGCDQWDDEAAEVAKRDAPADAVWTEYAVDGMHCGNCERRVIANVGQVEGVLAVEADAELGRVRVAVAKKGDPAAGAAEAKIRELGYKIQ